MTIQSALSFIQKIREDEAMRRTVQELSREESIEVLTKMGREYGFDFTPENFRMAFAHDWSLRWMYYSVMKNNYDSL